MNTAKSLVLDFLTNLHVNHFFLLKHLVFRQNDNIPVYQPHSDSTLLGLHSSGNLVLIELYDFSSFSALNILFPRLGSLKSSFIHSL